HRGTAKIRSLLDVHESESPSAPQMMRNALFLNTGTSHVLEAAHLTGLEATDWTWSVRFEDLDNDGWLDAHFTNGMVRELHNADLVQRISASESVNDGTRLMKGSPPLAEANLAYRNRGDLRFEPVGAAWGLDQKNVSFGAAFGDFDRDGDLDLAYTSYQGGLTLLRNDSDTGHRVVILLRGTRSNRFGVGATVRIESASGVQVRQLVLSRGYLSSSEPILHFGLGDDPRIDRLTVSWPSGQAQTFSDLNVDRQFTITEPAQSARAAGEALPAPHATEPRGQFTDVSESVGFSLLSRDERDAALNRQSLLPMRQDRRGPAVAVGDFDGDGVEDVVLGGTEKDPARLLLGTAAAFAKPRAIGVVSNADDGPLLAFDANADGRLDLLVTKVAELPPKLFLNDGVGGFAPAAADALPVPPMIAGAVVAADFDRDGQLDVFAGARLLAGQYPLSPRSALLANRGRTFVDVTDAIASGLREVGMVTSALWSDVDGDGWPDLLVALEWGGIRYWHNNEGRNFEDRSDTAGFSAAGTGWWSSLASADFNSDGRPDYVAGNVGLNTPYAASASQPALLYYGRFADSGTPQIIEAYQEGEAVYPRRPRQDLGAKIPSIQRRFPRGDLYAQGTLSEIVGEDRLKSAVRFAATEFRSGVFLSQADGAHRFAPLPRLAQIAPTQGLVAGDFDGDGQADILAVQNSYAPLASVGRFDGGLGQMLRGDGRGNFAAVPIAESGVVIPGDAKALVVVDFDHNGWPDFLVTRNNSTTLAFRNAGIAGRKYLKVSLIGPAGNPTAIAAWVTLELTDGSSQTVEVHGGSGYASQSSPQCFFGYIDPLAPRRVVVRWPTGVTTEHEASAAITNGILSLKSPP
ncbi:MAG TPA: FG-GAP-like repeat-containing protein, partial [Opitutus sp.]|nr:FG-GAP-like repeat-containing protein [Opitutus sp.]